MRKQFSRIFEEETLVVSPEESAELMRVTIDHNNKVAAKQKEIQQLDNQLVVARNTIRQKYAAKAKGEAAAKKNSGQKTTGTVDTAGKPVDSNGNPPTVESYGILKVKKSKLDEEQNNRLTRIYKYLKTAMKTKEIVKTRKGIQGVPVAYEQGDPDRPYNLIVLQTKTGKIRVRDFDIEVPTFNESKYNIAQEDPEEIQSLKDYLDAENISYLEDDEGHSIDFDDEEVNSEWVDQLADMKEDDNDDILTIEDDEDEPVKYEDDVENIDEEKVFYVKVKDEGQEFVGKLYKLFDDGDWRAKLIDGESETFEQLNYDPNYDQIDIVAFLRDNYDEANLIDEEEFNEYVESGSTNENAAAIVAVVRPVLTALAAKKSVEQLKEDDDEEDENENEEESMNESYASKFRKGNIQINDKVYYVNNVENINDKLDAITLANGKRLSSTWLEQNNAFMIPDERKKSASREKRMTKREYESMLKGAIHDLGNDFDLEHSEIYDMASSMINDDELYDYLERRNLKDQGMYPTRPRKRDLLNDLVTDLEMYTESKESEFKDEMNEKYRIPTLQEFLKNHK